MKFIYPAVFHEGKDGKYKGYFPDLECCYGEGDTIDDAIDDANEAARNWLSLELTEEDPFIPYVSDRGRFRGEEEAGTGCKRVPGCRAERSKTVGIPGRYGTGNQ